MAKRKIKPIFKVILVILIVVCLVFLYFSLKEKKIIKPNQEEVLNIETYNENIVDTEESNKDKIADIFVPGMKLKDFKEIFLEKDKKLIVNGNYTKIDYDFSTHISYSEAEEYFHELAKSKIVTINVIGISADSRKIYEIIIGTGEEVTVIEGGIHAAEMANPLYALKYTIDLVNSYEEGEQQVINTLNNKKIVVLPFVNPDGYEFITFGKEVINNKNSFVYKNITEEQLKYYKGNINGVDLNRNFPTQNAGLRYVGNELDNTISLVPSIEDYYNGEYLGSEPETKAIMYVMYKYLDNIENYISLHSMGRVIFNGKPHLSDEYNEKSHEAATLISSINDYTSFSEDDEDTGYGGDGTSSEFMAELAHGFKYSTKTNRLSTSEYAKANVGYNSKTIVIVMETLSWYYFDLPTIKDEYYDYGLYKSINKVINN